MKIKFSIVTIFDLDKVYPSFKEKCLPLEEVLKEIQRYLDTGETDTLDLITEDSTIIVEEYKEKENDQSRTNS